MFETVQASSIVREDRLNYFPSMMTYIKMFHLYVGYQSFVVNRIVVHLFSLARSVAEAFVSNYATE